MARLPIPGSDDGQWGNLLNDYLSVAHQTGGALKPGSVTVTAISDATITKAKLDSAVQASLTKADGAVDDSGMATLVATSGSATNTALTNNFAAKVHTHPISQVTGLQAALDGKAPTSSVSAVLIEASGVYPTRPTTYANVRFIGADDPGSAAQNGDEWIQLLP